MSDDKECNFEQKEKIKIITNFFLQVVIKAVKILILNGRKEHIINTLWKL